MKIADYLPSPNAWRKLAPMLLLMAAVLLLFRNTAVAMVSIWDRSDTFAHAFLVPPIVVWLVWRRRATLAALTPKPAPWVLLPMAAVCFLWLLGELAGVNAATQFALVALLVLSVPAVFGMPVARAVTLPLLFLFFCVPVGEFMVPPMMNWTADFAATAVRMSGVPLYREGLMFVIPSGSWSVVEACSGVRYLIASFMVGTLFAYLNFQSPAKRVVFMAASLMVPIVANWVRAYMIVMIGHLSNNKLAAGVDHIIYGWVFFGLVIGVMFMIGARFSDPEPDEPAPTVGAGTSFAPAGGMAQVWGVGMVAVLLLVGVQGAMWQLNRPHGNPVPAIELPQNVAGWARGDEPVSRWVPAYANAVVNTSHSYSQGDATVGLWVAYYRDQGYDRKMVTSSNNLAEMESTADWAQTASGSTAVQADGASVALRTADLRGFAEPGNPKAERIRVWTVFWVGGQLTTSDVRARIQIALNRLMGRGDDSAVLFFYAPVKATGASADADSQLQRFVPVALPSLVSLLGGAAGKR
jgi:exosortase A